MTGYELSKNWFNWAFENQGKVNPINTALYFFIIEYANKMGWVERFGLPTDLAKATIGINSYKTYIKALEELQQFGFIIVHQRSKNQYTTNIIALVKNAKATAKAKVKAFDKASLNHLPNQVQHSSKSKATIDKQETIKTNKQENKLSLLEKRKTDFYNSVAEFKDKYSKDTLRKFFNYWIEPNKSKTKMRFELEKTWDFNLRLTNWAGREKDFKKDLKEIYNGGKPTNVQPKRIKNEPKEPTAEERVKVINQMLDGLYKGSYSDLGGKLFKKFVNAGLIDNSFDGEAKKYENTLWAKLIIVKPDAVEFEKIERVRLFEFWHLNRVKEMFTKEELFTKLII